jgi:hypothetical protein
MFIDAFHLIMRIIVIMFQSPNVDVRNLNSLCTVPIRAGSGKCDEYFLYHLLKGV